MSKSSRLLTLALSANLSLAVQADEASVKKAIEGELS